MTNLLLTSPSTIINDKIQIRDQRALKSLASIPSKYSYINFHDTGAFQSHDPVLNQKAFLHVITCTVFNYPCVFNSEKNFKPIVNFRPFVLVSSPGGLENMRKAGFKTFGEYWSEEYDNIQDPVERMLAIVGLIEFVCSKSTEELKSMLMDMQEILTYNSNFYIESFKDHELKKFDLECQRNLGVR